MASFRKRPDGKWRAEIARMGKRKSKIFNSKQAAKDWAAMQERDILDAPNEQFNVLLGEAFERYSHEVSPKKGGVKWEQGCIKRLPRHEFCAVKMSDISPELFAKWRDVRLCEVAPATVNREMVLMSAVLTTARREWGLIDQNPLKDVKKPTKPPARDRLVTDNEMSRLAMSAGKDLTNLTARSFHAFKFACETAMRAGEIVSLDWRRVDLEIQVCHLDKTKNGTARDVPLSKAAVDLVRALPRCEVAPDAPDLVFKLNSRQLDVLWRKLRDRADVHGLHFHDSRHYAITNLAQKVEVLDLARIVGHRNLNQLMAYYNASASDIAKRLG